VLDRDVWIAKVRKGAQFSLLKSKCLIFDFPLKPLQHMDSRHKANRLLP
jgi:hypothetical protein